MSVGGVEVRSNPAQHLARYMSRLFDLRLYCRSFQSDAGIEEHFLDKAFLGRRGWDGGRGCTHIETAGFGGRKMKGASVQTIPLMPRSFMVRDRVERRTTKLTCLTTTSFQSDPSALRASTLGRIRIARGFDEDVRGEVLSMTRVWALARGREENSGIGVTVLES